jgi:hypothetical protein
MEIFGVKWKQNVLVLYQRQMEIFGVKWKQNVLVLYQRQMEIFGVSNRFTVSRL